MDDAFYDLMWQRTAQAIEDALGEWAARESMTAIEVARRVLLGELDTPTFLMDVEDRFPQALWPLDDFHAWLLLQGFIKQSSVRSAGAPTR